MTELMACARDFKPSKWPMRSLGDKEGLAVPAACAGVIDAHVHLFHPRLFAAIWRWFEQHGWPVRYQLQADEIIEFLASSATPIDSTLAISRCFSPHSTAMRTAR